MPFQLPSFTLHTFMESLSIKANNRIAVIARLIIDMMLTVNAAIPSNPPKIPITPDTMARMVITNATHHAYIFIFQMPTPKKNHATAKINVTSPVATNSDVNSASPRKVLTVAPRTMAITEPIARITASAHIKMLASFKPFGVFTININNQKPINAYKSWLGNLVCFPRSIYKLSFVFILLMSLQRKARTVGGSLNVVIPSQIAELHGIDEGSLLEFQPMQKGVFKLIKLEGMQMCSIKNKDTGETKKVPLQFGRCIPPQGWEKT